MKMTFPFREIFFRVNFFIFAIVSIGKIRRITFVYAKVFAKMSDILHENINFQVYFRENIQKTEIYCEYQQGKVNIFQGSRLILFPLLSIIQCVWLEPIHWVIEDQAFLDCMIQLLAHPFPPPASKLSLCLSLPVRRRSSLVKGEKRGWPRSRIKPPREGLSLYKSFNTLW